MVIDVNHSDPWYKELGLSEQEIKFQEKCEVERPNRRQFVNQYILDNHITGITDSYKLVRAISANFLEYAQLSKDDAFMFWGLTLIAIEGWREHLLDRKQARARRWTE